MADGNATQRWHNLVRERIIAQLLKSQPPNLPTQAKLQTTLSAQSTLLAILTLTDDCWRCFYWSGNNGRVVSCSAVYCAIWLLQKNNFGRNSGKAKQIKWQFWTTSLVIYRGVSPITAVTTSRPRSHGCFWRTSEAFSSAYSVRNGGIFFSVKGSNSRLHFRCDGCYRSQYFVVNRRLAERSKATSGWVPSPKISNDDSLGEIGHLPKDI